ncbi:siderophore-interacting protein [Longimycelium tulufanense]|uniref:Siderophore-interacting protein n=1 Tax=Longimycelium tulufanense TaxID=907463 RepID=A0A8J3FTI7_9PSEU|nr:sigma-70 family RNA polymerase sigma factor [Longimycelium tulufanense]GGM40333.1 siderophore-interacting protein [Longimycelium tulufanense]
MDQARFTRLYQDTYGTVFAYAYRRMPPSDVPDLVAETFLTAWRRRTDLPDPPLPWLLTVTRNLIRNRRRRVSIQDAVTVELRRYRIESQGSVEGEVVERITVLSALAALDEGDREVLLLTCWDGLSAREAATVLRCSTPAFAVRLHRARRRVTALLDQLDTNRHRPRGRTHESART